jgi:hypothetical protein
MTRILYTVGICALVLVGIASVAPPQLAKKIGLFHEPAATHTVPADITPAVPRNVNARPVKVSKAPPESTPAPAEPAEPKVEPSPVEKVNPAVVSIESEQPLSLRNSPRGPVIGQVQKGERVERQFEVYEAGEKWVFVSVATQNLAGFLESESLETRKNPAP